MTAFPGQVFHKYLGAIGGTIIYGMDVSSEIVRFWCMDSTVQFFHGIPAGDSKWHYYAGTYVREQALDTMTVYP